MPLHRVQADPHGKTTLATSAAPTTVQVETDPDQRRPRLRLDTTARKPVRKRRLGERSVANDGHPADAEPVFVLAGQTTLDDAMRWLTAYASGASGASRPPA
jgi:hypothetical protein